MLVDNNAYWEVRMAFHADSSVPSVPGPASLADGVGIDLYWLPLGAGGHFVRMNGRIYEAVVAGREGRQPLDLYHSALQVLLPEGRFVIENSWPIPDADGTERGVVVQGPVGSRRFEGLRALRYEIRRWREGVIPDIAEAVDSPQRLTRDEDRARLLLDLAPTVPPLVWGRDELALGDMWNSNSVISFLLTCAGLQADQICAPAGGRAPGWAAGWLLARRSVARRPETLLAAPFAGSPHRTVLSPRLSQV